MKFGDMKVGQNQDLELGVGWGAVLLLDTCDGFDF